MEEELNQYVFEIVNPTWNRIVRYLLKEYHDEFFKFPAAKSNHHAYAGGLAFHTLSILRLAKAVTVDVKYQPLTNVVALVNHTPIIHDELRSCVEYRTGQ